MMARGNQMKKPQDNRTAASTGALSATWLTLVSMSWAPATFAQQDQGNTNVTTQHKLGLLGRELRKEVMVPAPREAVFRMWTTSDGIPKFFFPKADIDLDIGGRYDLYDPNFEPDMHGRRGAQGCKVLSFIPHEMLSFDWTFPSAVMSLRSLQAKTIVVLRFDEAEVGKTRVRFVQLGWQEGDAWDQGYQYFDKAWSTVLTRLAEYFVKNPVEVSARKVVNKQDMRTWPDGHVTVRTGESPVKYQEFEMTVPVSVGKVWNALATSEGLIRLGGKDSEVELKAGGKYAFWPGAPNQVLSYVPQEMLSTSGSAPPEFPNVRKSGTWSAYFFEAIDAHTTRIRLPVHGWKPGEEEWDKAYDYFLKNNAVFLNQVYEVLVSSK